MARGTKTLNSALQVDDDGNVFVQAPEDEPADAALGNGQIVFWADTGTGKIMVKAKSRSGTVASGEVAQLA